MASTRGSMVQVAIIITLHNISTFIRMKTYEWRCNKLKNLICNEISIAYKDLIHPETYQASAKYQHKAGTR